LIQRSVRAVIVVMGDVLAEHSFEMMATEDQRPVEALTADSADETFREGVGPWSSDRGLDDADTICLEHWVWQLVVLLPPVATYSVVVLADATPAPTNPTTLAIRVVVTKSTIPNRS
jgi:hypothetical protein